MPRFIPFRLAAACVLVIVVSLVPAAAPVCIAGICPEA